MTTVNQEVQAPLEMKALRVLDDIDFSLFLMKSQVEGDTVVGGIGRTFILGDISHITDLVAGLRAELRAAS